MKIIQSNILKINSCVNFKYKRLSRLFHSIKNQKNIDKLMSILYSFSGKIIFSLKREESLKEILKLLMKNKIYPKYIKKIIDINMKIDYFYMIEEINNQFLDKKNNLLFIYTKDLLPVLINNKYISNIKKKTALLKKAIYLN